METLGTPFYENEKFLNASKKFKEVGHFGVTSEDHHAIASTPSELLMENPGKTYAELLSDEEILFRLKELDEGITEFSNEEESQFTKSYLEILRNDMKTSIDYLRSINRLPKEFENYEMH